MSEYGGRHDIRLTLNICLNERQAVFGMKIENSSEYIVENVYYPYLGDVQHPPAEEWFKTFIYQYATAQEWSLWPIYQSLREYYFVDYPTQFSQKNAFSGAPMSPYCLLRGLKQGLYIGICDPSPELVAWHTELRPGYSSSMDARVPEELMISDKDVATRFAAVHVPFIQPNETRALTPITFEVYEGGWQKGVDIYKQWRSGWMKTPAVPS